MMRSNPFLSALSCTTGLTAILALAVGSAAQAAVTTRLSPAAVRVGSPQWFLSHLNAYRLPPRNAAIRNASASTYPLNAPFGLTVAPNGDLYVANLLANQVLVYGSNLIQKTGNTISAAVSHPSGVAIDSTGEVFVSNIASNAITVYSSNHVYLPNRTIVANINTPAAIAVDGLDDVYVNEDYAAVGLYSSFGGYQGNLPLSGTLGSVNSIATRGHLFMLAGSSQVQYYPSTELLIVALEYPQLGLVAGHFGNPANNSLGVTSDANGNLYEATDDPAIVFVNTLTGRTQTLVSLPFIPAAIAIDLNNNHIFVADLYHNAIAVYTLAGHLLTTLH